MEREARQQRAEAIDRFWDDLVADGQPERSPVVDDVTETTIRRVSAIGDVPGLTAARQRIWDSLVHESRRKEPDMTALFNAPLGDAAHPWPGSNERRDTRPRPDASWRSSSETFHRAWAQVATAALVLLTLAASLIAFGPLRRGGEERLAALPAAAGSPVEFVWQLAGGPALPFNNPTALAFDPAGNLWVPDGSNARFQIFTPDGEFRESWGTPGSGDGEFNLSLGGYGYGAVVWDGDGNIYVADSGNFRIQKFSPERRFLAAWGSRGNGDGQFIGLNNLAFDREGRLHATDHERDDIQVFDRDGRFLGAWGGPGFGEGELDNPGSVAEDADGNLYVSEYMNHRVQKFSPDGASLTTWGSFGRDEGQLNYPTDVTLDGNGHAFIADWGNHRVQVFDMDGQYLAAWGELGFDEGQFVNPIFAALDGQGFIYVSDEGTDRVQKFRLLPPLT